MSGKRFTIGGAGRGKHQCGWMLSCLLAVGIGGCGDSGPPRYQVSGNVTHQGQPVPKGSIIFQPEDTASGGGEYGMAAIRDGRFDTAGEGGRGILGGSHLVTIEAFDGSDANLDLMPDGRSLSNGYRKSFDLPKEDSTLDIELTGKP